MTPKPSRSERRTTGGSEPATVSCGVTWHWLDGSEGTHNVTSKAGKHGLRFKGSGTKTRGAYTVTFKLSSPASTTTSAPFTR